MTRTVSILSLALTLAGAVALAEGQRGGGAPPPPPEPTSALAPANLAKPRPKAPFDLTGVWLHGGGQNNAFRFTPPASQVMMAPTAAGLLLVAAS